MRKGRERRGGSEGPIPRHLHTCTPYTLHTLHTHTTHTHTHLEGDVMDSEHDRGLGQGRAVSIPVALLHEGLRGVMGKGARAGEKNPQINLSRTLSRGAMHALCQS